MERVISTKNTSNCVFHRLGAYRTLPCKFRSQLHRYDIAYRYKSLLTYLGSTSHPSLQQKVRDRPPSPTSLSDIFEVLLQFCRTSDAITISPPRSFHSFLLLVPPHSSLFPFLQNDEVLPYVHIRPPPNLQKRWRDAKSCRINLLAAPMQAFPDAAQ